MSRQGNAKRISESNKQFQIFSFFPTFHRQSIASSSQASPPNPAVTTTGAAADLDKIKDEFSSSTFSTPSISSSQQTPLLSHGTPDPYLTHFDPRSEHQSYKQAQMRLEELHKEEVTKVLYIKFIEFTLLFIGLHNVIRQFNHFFFFLIQNTQ